MIILELTVLIVILLSFAATAGTNKAASSSTTLNTRKLDEETENLAREFVFTLYYVLRKSCRSYENLYLFVVCEK